MHLRQNGRSIRLPRKAAHSPALLPLNNDGNRTGEQRAAGLRLPLPETYGRILIEIHECRHRKSMLFFTPLSVQSSRRVIGAGEPSASVNACRNKSHCWLFRPPLGRATPATRNRRGPVRSEKSRAIRQTRSSSSGPHARPPRRQITTNCHGRGMHGRVS